MYRARGREKTKDMRHHYTQPSVETTDMTPQQVLCGSFKAEIDGYDTNTGGGFTQTF